MPLPPYDITVMYGASQQLCMMFYALFWIIMCCLLKDFQPYPSGLHHWHWGSYKVVIVELIEYIPTVKHMVPISPREPHALAWSPTFPVTSVQKSFGSSKWDWNQWKNCWFLVNFAPTDSLHVPVLATVRFTSIRSWQILKILHFTSSRWWMPFGLLWFGYIN